MLEALEKLVIDRGAWERFLELGLPTKEWEQFRYVRLSELYSHTYERAQESDLTLIPKVGELVFVNGLYREDLSRPPSGVVPLPLSQALKTYSGFLTQRLAAQEKDPFAALNRALCSGGLFLYLPPQSVSKVEIVHYVTEQKGRVIMTPRLHIFAGKGAEAKLSYSYQTAGWVNSFVDIALDEEASITLTTHLDKNPSSWHFDALRATLKRGSRLKTYAVAGGAATSRQDYKIQLLEEGCEASLYGVSQVEERSHHHINVLMEHHAPQCRSLQHFKNVLRDVARTSFEGKIYVDKRAQKTEAFQRNNNLVLSPRASANTKPNLEIFADDVKASHGATVGQLDVEQLFYLQARGIPLKLAKEILVQGFCREILEQI